MKTRNIFQKYKVKNVIEIEQLTEKLKHKYEQRPKESEDTKIRKNQYTLNKMFKEDIKQLYRYSGAKVAEVKDQPHMEEFELCWKSLREKAQYNNKAK
jgi:hypothetical protein